MPLVDEQAEAVQRPSRKVEWAEICAYLRDTLSETTFNAFFADARGAFDGEAFVVTVRNNFIRSWIENHFLEVIQRVAGDDRLVRITVEPPEQPVPARSEESALHRVRAVGIKAKYTFDSFVIGSSNRFAHAAALAVAEAPARAYNPLFIYGGTGLGKTHLLQSIARYVADHSGNLSVRYLTSEAFLNDFSNSLRNNRIEVFKHRYRTTYDILLVDDVQFFEKKEQIQDEFFHTFNSLYETGRQIVMSSDRPPRDIATLEERLRSRFQWGLITDIQPPDLETRIAILRKKVQTERISISDPEVLTFVAGRVSANIRELEGALNRVVAFSSLTTQPMTVELAQSVLQDAFPQGQARKVSMERIKETVSERFGVSLEELIGKGRAESIAYPRQIAVYLCRELTDSSLPTIGKEFGGRDHTTILYATSKIGRLIRERRDVYNLVQDLTARIKQLA